MLKKYIGDKDFYRSALAIALPIMLQSGITNLVNLIDNIMIGSIGTLEMSGVAITNQLIFIFNLCIFGAVSGAGIFCAQFFGKSDYEGVRQSTRFKIIACVLLALAGIGVFYFLVKIPKRLRGERRPQDCVIEWLLEEIWLLSFQVVCPSWLGLPSQKPTDWMT